MCTWERGWDLTGYIDWSVCVENYERPSYIHTYIEEHRSLRMHAWEIKNARYDGEGEVCVCVHAQSSVVFLLLWYYINMCQGAIGHRSSPNIVPSCLLPYFFVTGSLNESGSYGISDTTFLWAPESLSTSLQFWSFKCSSLCLYLMGCDLSPHFAQ